MTAFKKQYNPNLTAIYHGKMSSADQKITLTGWKTGLYCYMIATNAFGMGVHVPDVRVIIHATFPMSITNLVQEIGHAARDGNSGNSIVFYSQNDIRKLVLIKTKNNRSFSEFSQHDDSIATIFESSYCFEDFYTCREILYYTPFNWTTDLQIPECDKCDNCIKRD
ncbi:12089_t:CDS:2 [Gigaspora rosea]|nr:12089_t:CDS:2 [Gigaspora rosea]